MKTMPYYSVSSPARFCEEECKFETINIIADIEYNKIELVSEDGKGTINLDLIGASELVDVLQKITNSKRFQSDFYHKKSLVRSKMVAKTTGQVI